MVAFHCLMVVLPYIHMVLHNNEPTQKCHYSVMPEFFSPTEVNTLFFFPEMEIQNWHNAILEVRILQLHILLCYAMSYSDFGIIIA